MICSILAGEHGPSCKRQIPKIQVFYVRLPLRDQESYTDTNKEQVIKQQENGVFQCGHELNLKLRNKTT